MSKQQREEVGKLTKIYKKVAATTVAVPPIVTGKIGASPEIYEFIDPEQAEGMVIAFSGSAMQMTYRTQPVNRENLLAVLRNAYKLSENGAIELPFLFAQPDAVCSAFLISQEKSLFRIESSTCWLEDVTVKDKSELSYITGALGQQEILCKGKNVQPIIKSVNQEKIAVQTLPLNNGMKILVSTFEPGTKVTISIQSGK
jgi:hypothetical protein